LYQAGVTVSGTTTDLSGNPMNTPPSVGCYQYKAPVLNTATEGKVLMSPQVPNSDQSNMYGMSCNFIKGGTHIYDSIDKMWAIPTALRMAGMRCIITPIFDEYELLMDLKTWLRVPRIQPIRPVYMASVQHILAQNANAGVTPTISTWTTRPLNTIVYDDNINIGLASNEVTLRSGGAYRFDATGIVDKPNATMLRIYDVTNSVVLAQSLSGYSTNANSSNMAIRITGARVTLRGPTVIRLEQWVSAQSSVPAETFGRPTNATGASEIYAHLLITALR
jgi:hypothetical protein